MMASVSFKRCITASATSRQDAGSGNQLSLTYPMFPGCSSSFSKEHFSSGLAFRVCSSIFFATASTSGLLSLPADAAPSLPMELGNGWYGRYLVQDPEPRFMASKIDLRRLIDINQA